MELRGNVYTYWGAQTANEHHQVVRCWHEVSKGYVGTQPVQLSGMQLSNGTAWRTRLLQQDDVIRRKRRVDGCQRPDAIWCIIGQKARLPGLKDVSDVLPPRGFKEAGAVYKYL